MLPGDDFIDWTFGVFEHLVTTFGVIGGESGRAAYLPVEADFAVPVSRDASYAQRMLEHMRTQCEFEADLRTEIEVVAPVPQVSDILPVYDELASDAGFTCACSWDEEARCFRISLVQPVLGDPMKLVSSIAYSLASVCVMLLPEEVAINDEEEMNAWTEVCTVYLGYGVFIANDAVNYENHSRGVMQGWSTARNTILSEEQIAVAIAIQLLVSGTDPRQVLKELKPNPRATLSAAMDDIGKRWAERIRGLRVIAAKE